MFEIITSYSFRIVFFGTLLLAIASSIVGTINIYNHQSMIGDAIGHSTYPGVILAFILFQSRNTLLLLGGAFVSGLCAYLLIQRSSKASKIKLDANLAIFLSGFFGLGLVLKSFLQGNADFKTSQAGLDHYIFGQAAYLTESDLITIALVTFLCIILFLVFYKEIEVQLFDLQFAQVIGLPTKLIDFIFLIMTLLVISAGIKMVGAILISSFLIIPTISAMQWSNKFRNVVILSCIISSFSAFVGSYISSLEVGYATGPVIILVGGLIAIVSLFFSPNGIISKKLRRKI